MRQVQGKAGWVFPHLAVGSDPSCPREGWDLVSGTDLQRTDVLLIKPRIPLSRRGLRGGLTPKEDLGTWEVKTSPVGRMPQRRGSGKGVASDFDWVKRDDTNANQNHKVIPFHIH